MYNNIIIMKTEYIEIVASKTTMCIQLYITRNVTQYTQLKHA